MARPPKQRSKEFKAKDAILLFSFILVVWGFYRLLFQLPEEVEELLLKPVVWLVPTALLIRKEGVGLESIGITKNNLGKSLLLSVLLGTSFVLVGLFVNSIKYSRVSIEGINVFPDSLLPVFLLSLVTASVEELTFRGYLYTRAESIIGNELSANLATTVGWVIIHIPIAVFVWKLAMAQLAVYLFLVFIFGFGSGFVFARTRNITSSVLLHVFWSWPIILFR